MDYLRIQYVFYSIKKLLISNSFGDLENNINYNHFEYTIKNFIKRNNFHPEVIVCDKHPDFLSGIYAEKFGIANKIPIYKIQHHYAHLLSVLAENNFYKKTIGVLFDGTGYGDDGNIWGGEFIVGNHSNYIRAAHLKYRKLPGGDAASREGYRMAISLLNEFLSKKNILRMYKRINAELIMQMLDKNINTPLTSSAGRIFDAVASIIGICDISTYEAEAAIKLQASAQSLKGREIKAYSFKIKKTVNGIYEADIIPAIKEILEDKNKKSKAYIAMAFHKTLACLICDTVKILAKKHKVLNIALSGGVFQNSILLNETINLLKKNRFNVLMHNKLSPGDASISLGQAVYGAIKG